MNIVDCLLGFEKEGKINLLMTEQSADMEDLRVITIELLSWMKLQQKRLLWIEDGRKTSLKPLELKMAFPWCQILCQYVKTQDVFSSVFEVSNGKLDFKKDLPEDYVLYAFRTAYEQYNPPIVAG